jgi:beta-lactamase superfamily II metal-dependent hydrolase
MVDIEGFRFLFTGDENGKRREAPSSNAPIDIEAKLLDLEARFPGTLREDVLKVPHHGSETASTDAFINAVNPRFVFFSASTLHNLPKRFCSRTVRQRHACHSAHGSELRKQQ